MRYQGRVPEPKCESLFFVVNGVFLGSFLIYLMKTQGFLNASWIGDSSIMQKCSDSNPQVRGSIKAIEAATSGFEGDGIDYSYNFNTEAIESCLDPNGPLPVIVMSLGRSGTDSTWQILKALTGTTMKAVEIVGGFEDESVEFFRALEGLRSDADTWASEEGYDWRKKGGGLKSVRGFYDYIRDFCADGNCKDGKWIFKWFCDEQQRHKETGGLVGFKWKAYMSALRTQSAYNALKMLAQLGLSNTPIRVIRSRRNPLDVYLSELKHSSQEGLPDHCKKDDDECMKKHSSIKLVVPTDEMREWLYKTYEEENEIDSLLSEIGIRTIHIVYDDLYYARTEEEGLREWLKIFRFLDQPADYEWSDIAGAVGLKPTTKSRSHNVLIENFEEVYAVLKDTKLENFIRME